MFDVDDLWMFIRISIAILFVIILVFTKKKMFKLLCGFIVMINLGSIIVDEIYREKENKRLEEKIIGKYYLSIEKSDLRINDPLLKDTFIITLDSNNNFYLKTEFPFCKYGNSGEWGCYYRFGRKGITELVYKNGYRLWFSLDISGNDLIIKNVVFNTDSTLLEQVLNFEKRKKIILHAPVEMDMPKK